MIKKIVYRAEAVLIAVSVFFCSILYKPLCVEASGFAVTFIQQLGWIALGYLVDDYLLDPLTQKLGWSSADIQVDENGNVIISEAQMQELKDAINEYTRNDNGNDKYGMYLYEATGRVPAFAEWDSGYNEYKGLAGECNYWFSYSGGGIAANRGYFLTVAPEGCFFIGDSSYVTFVSYDEGTGQLIGLDAICYQNGTYREDVTRSPNQSVYCGNPHMAFLSEQGAQAWASDGCPYTMVAPTYTGGSLTIPADQLKDTDGDGIPDIYDPHPYNPDDGGEEDGGSILEQILSYVKKIYHQLIIGNVVNAVDAVAQVMETAKEYMDEALEDAAAIGELGEALTTKFPFSLPQTLLALLTVFEAEPVAPVWEVPFRADFGGATGIKIDESITIDFSEFQDAVDILKWFLGIIWIYGLIRLTPRFLDVGGVTDGGGGSS